MAQVRLYTHKLYACIKKYITRKILWHETQFKNKKLNPLIQPTYEAWSFFEHVTKNNSLLSAIVNTCNLNFYQIYVFKFSDYISHSDNILHSFKIGYFLLHLLKNIIYSISHFANNENLKL